MALDLLARQFHSGQYLACVNPGKDLYDTAIGTQCPDIAAAAAALVALAMANTGQNEAVPSWAERALALYVNHPYSEQTAPQARRRLEDSAAIAWVALATHHAFTGAVPEALRAMTGAQVALGGSAQNATRMVVHTGLGLAYYRMGLPMQALDALRQGLALADARVPPTRRLRMQLNVLLLAFDVYNLLEGGRADDAAALLDDMQTGLAAAVALAEEVGTDEARDAVAPAGAAVSYRQGDAIAARRWLARVLDEQGVLKPAQREFETYALLALIERELGNAPASLAAAERSQAMLANVDLTTASANRLWYASRLAELRGDLALALALSRRQIGLVVQNHDAALGARMAQLLASRYLDHARHEGQRAAAPPAPARGGSDTNTDMLTGLPGRQQMAQRFRALQAASTEPLTLVLLNLDNFRQVNLHHTYGVGDQVLYQAGRLMQAVVSARGDLGRLGGKSFVMLLPGAQLGVASVLMRRLRQSMAQYRWNSIAADLPPVTCSGGMTQVDPHETFEAALERAEELAHAAKRAGRNRICISPARDQGCEGIPQVF